MRRIAITTCLAGLLLGAIAGPAGAATFTPASLSFGNQPTGTTSPPRTVVLNRDSDPAFNVNLAINGDFKLTHSCPALLAPLLADSCTLGVSFSPSGPGPRGGTLIANSLIFGGPVATLSGTGTGAADSPAGPKACKKGKKKKKGKRKRAAAAKKRKGKKKGKGCKKGGKRKKGKRKKKG